MWHPYWSSSSITVKLWIFTAASFFYGIGQHHNDMSTSGNTTTMQFLISH